jgi:hypothetical protein
VLGSPITVAADLSAREPPVARAGGAHPATGDAADPGGYCVVPLSIVKPGPGPVFISRDVPYFTAVKGHMSGGELKSDGDLSSWGWHACAKSFSADFAG